MRLFLENSFPIKIVEAYDETFDEYKEDLVLWIEQNAQTQSSRHVSNRHGYQSHDKIYEDPEFIRFMQERISPIFAHVFKTYYNNKRFVDKEVVFDLCNCWYNINYPGSYNVTHVHPGSNLSVVFYVKVPENSGNLIFNNPRAYCDWFLIDDPSREIQPQEGKFIFFPSSLEHTVQENKSNETRISIAFNFGAYIR